MKAAPIVTDFSQYASLRADARAQNPEAMEKTARQFEALLLQQMLKSMRQASLGEDVMGGGQMPFYQDLFDQQLASHLSNQSGIGIAQLLVRQLQQRAGAEVPEPAGVTALDAVSEKPAATAPAAVKTAVPDEDFRPRNAQAFVEALRPHAERAGKALGIPARVLIAQAALETGWGQHQIRHSDGRPAFNLFGIKADSRWDGDRVSMQTQEFEDGAFVRRSAGFRAYGSIAESFDDYVRFMKDNPRYADALRHEGSARRYVTGLHSAGYATDPGYADKILRIAYGPTLQLALQKTATVSA